jgi:phosphonate ABC transporter permease subunit PhnE
MMEQPSKESRWRHALRSGRQVILIILLLLVFAYAIDVTQINLETPQLANRQETTIRVIRSLARPDILEYDEESRSMDITIRMPCPEDPRASQITFQGRQVVLSPNCASTTQDVLLLTGEGFRQRTEGIVRWYPPGTEAATRAVARFTTDGEGSFTTDFTMPDIRPSDEPQRLELVETWQTGIAGLSQASIITIEKIIETIFLALVATVIGTALSIPISFIAARNLMTKIDAPLAAIMLSIIAFPIGWFIGSFVIRWLVNASGLLGDSTLMMLPVGVVALGVTWSVLHFGPPVLSPRIESRQQQTTSMLRLLVAAVFVIFGLSALARFGLQLGETLEAQLGPFGFLGNALYFLSEAYLVLSPAVVGLFLALIALSLGSRYGEEIILHTNEQTGRLITAVIAGLGSTIFIYGIGAALNWLYQFDQPQYWTLYPALIGGAIMAIAGFLTQPRRPFPIGFALYTVTRTVLNVIRAIEPLIYVIVFVVWVGIGPFAGVIALTLHTIASLAKLFSEEIEGISEGPIEAVTATGANQLQMIRYAVVPQVVPPFTAFTLYRWDINVRFSTVLGFAGGGGIGFVLIQYINLLQYRQAAVMMIAIAIVVMVLDYISSSIRNRII